ncbi:MAG TPA: hypothetical protein VGR06_34030 [Actinophytocola sp.]|jgi:hypothetical protein|uniref:hypothetical protein n=1 Tax=Actinophytocola sp. TaxID=1872138 RepID=UPI002DFA45A2|nr:hypothetical protein [Actinophytocola sp.]
MIDTSTRRERAIIYGAVAAVALALMIIGLFAWHSGKSTEAAGAKADQLSAALRLAGAQVPDRDEIVRRLGDDGGAVCADPTGALSKAALQAQLSNGAGGPGTRPVITASRVVRGEALVIGIYCPDKLPDFQQFIDSLYTSG